MSTDIARFDLSDVAVFGLPLRKSSMCRKSLRKCHDCPNFLHTETRPSSLDEGEDNDSSVTTEADATKERRDPGGHLVEVPISSTGGSAKKSAQFFINPSY